MSSNRAKAVALGAMLAASGAGWGLLRADDAPKAAQDDKAAPARSYLLKAAGGGEAKLEAGGGGGETIGKADLEALFAQQAKAARRLGKSPGDEVEIPTFRGRVLTKARARLLDPAVVEAAGGVRVAALAAATAVDPEKSLMIRDLRVVNDARAADGGKWSFGYLMTQLANTPKSGVSAPDFARRWLRRWEFAQVVNDFPVPPRAAGIGAVIQTWVDASGGPGHPLDMTKAPFRLLAIVNRVDLRAAGASPESFGGGEARFVFCALDAAGNPLQFTVIFEYGLRFANNDEVRAWGKRWYDLNGLDLNDATQLDQFKADLEGITEVFARADAAPSRPNGSALNQLRTNEIALSAPWELREFRIAADEADKGHLREVTVKQTPDGSLQNTARLADYINSNASAILVEQHDVPGDFPAGMPFLGGNAQVPFPPDFAWTAPMIPSREARMMFSLQTCNGCHAGETATAFTHVKPRPQAAAADLSVFLTGGNVPDPIDAVPTRSFNDLARRARHLDLLVNLPPSLAPFVNEAATRMTH